MLMWAGAMQAARLRRLCALLLLLAACCLLLLLLLLLAAAAAAVWAKTLVCVRAPAWSTR